MQNVFIGVLVLTVEHYKFQSLVQYHATQRVCHNAFIFHNCEIRNNVNISSWKRRALSCFILDITVVSQYPGMDRHAYIIIFTLKLKFHAI